MIEKPKRNGYQQAEMEKVVYNWLIGGYSNKRIIDKLIDEYQYKKPNAEKLIYKIVKELTDLEVNEVNELKTKYQNMFLDLYDKAVKNNDTRSANDILKSIMKLQGLDIQKVEANVTTTFEVKFDNNDEKTNN